MGKQARKPKANDLVRHFIWLALLLVLAAATWIQLLPAQVRADTPLITIRPTIITPPWVDIPDANLKAALHTLCGVPLTGELTRSDLAGLTGTLNIVGKGIANLEGIQYCNNITTLSASNNPISNLPDMTGMTSLKTLNLDSCHFAAVPAAVRQIPLLQSLNLNNNQIGSVSGVSGCLKLKSLQLGQNEISALPDSLDLPMLAMLNLTDNHLAEFPVCLLGLTTLNNLYLDRNDLEALPDGLEAMPGLIGLALSGNRLRSLPTNLGTSGLQYLSLGQNLITSFPEMILELADLKILDLSLNRLTSVPAGLSGKAYEFLNIEFNYLDMSPESSSRTILESVTTIEKYIDRQLTPIKNLRATASGNSIRLTWDQCPDTTTADYSSLVQNYIVYLNEAGSLVSLATLNAGTFEFADTGLPPAISRKYTIAVVYQVTAPLISATSRHYSSVTTATAAPTPSPTPQPTPTLQPTPTPSSPAATTGSQLLTEQTAAVSSTSSIIASKPLETTAQKDQGDANGIPGWLLVLVAGVAAAGIAASSVMLYLLRKKSRT